MQKSDLPFGSEFSPSNVELRRVLELANEHGGDWKKFEAAIHDEFFNLTKFPNTSDYNRRKRADNVKLAMRAYGLINDDANLTQVGRKLYEVCADKNTLYSLLANHILLNLHGMTLVQTIQHQ